MASAFVIAFARAPPMLQSSTPLEQNLAWGCERISDEYPSVVEIVAGSPSNPGILPS